MRYRIGLALIWIHWGIESVARASERAGHRLYTTADRLWLYGYRLAFGAHDVGE